MRLTAAVLLAIALAGVVWFVRGDLGEYRRFRQLTDTASRQKRYRLWLLKAALAFVLPSVVALLLLGRPEAVVDLPGEFTALRGDGPRLSTDALGSVVGGAGIGMAIGLGLVALATWLRRRWRPATPGSGPRMLGNVAALLPRNRQELPYGAALSLMAGISEELFFRLVLPLLIAIVTGSALLAVGAGVVIFALMHRYQGWVGVLATGVLGAIFTVLYIASGALWLAMVLHVMIDLGGLVVRPIIAGAWRPAE